MFDLFLAPADFQFIPPGLDVDSKTGKSRHNLSRTGIIVKIHSK